jgi:uncharacterized membrane protein YqgA involved in biofilm formation
MANEAESMIIPLISEIRGEVLGLLNDIRMDLEQVGQRLDKLRCGQKAIGRALAARRVQSKHVAGVFEQRIVGLERKVDSLTKGK